MDIDEFANSIRKIFDKIKGKTVTIVYGMKEVNSIQELQIHR